MKDLNLKDKFVELRAEGKSFVSISEELKVSKPTLIGWSKDLRHEISNLRQIQLEAIREKYRIGKEKRAERLSNHLVKIENEFEKRNLETVPTHKLFELMLKIFHEIEFEDETLNFTSDQTDPCDIMGDSLKTNWQVV